MFGSLSVFVVLLRAQNAQEPMSHPALAQDLVSDSGTKLVEVTEATFRSTKVSLNGYFCKVKNVSGKEITALGVVWTALFSDGSAAQSRQFIDSRINKDIIEARGLKPIAPNEEREFRSSSTESFSKGLSIKSVKVKVDFVEFADSSSVGTENSKTYRQLMSVRQGADFCKQWLTDIYKNSPQNINLLVEKLSSNELPNDKELENSSAKQGAIIYQKTALRVYQKEGAGALQRLLQ
jgi:hypothetical protein